MIALLGLLFVAKKVSDFLNGLSSGGLGETLARFIFVQGIADTVFGQNGFPSTFIREGLKLSEFANRASQDPLGMLLVALGPGGAGVLPEADSWAGSLLKKLQAEHPLDAVVTGIINDFVAADKQVNFFNLVALAYKGCCVVNSIPSLNYQKTGGDPVFLGRGEFARQCVDLEIAGAGINFVLGRTYRSKTIYFGPLGPGWDHSYNLRLHQENEFIVLQLTGQLSSQMFVRHPQFGQTDFNYFAPPNGVHDVLVPSNSSFTLEKTDGTTYRYEATDQPNEHRIRWIEDRFGNYLDFRYSAEDRLSAVYVNSPERYAVFSYNELSRLSCVADHTGRTVTYAYDDWGFLESATQVHFPGTLPQIAEKYEYSQVGSSHKLAKVFDRQGRLLVENEYEQSPLSEFYGHVIRQLENQGEANFVYTRLWEKMDFTTPLGTEPVLRVDEYRRNGHKVEHYLNEFGNELLKREAYAAECSVQEAITRYHYNADGELIAQVDPNGVVRQYLYGREHLADTRHWSDQEFELTDITKKDRMAFGNLLAEVTRSKLVPRLGFSLSTIDWLAQVPSVKTLDSSRDHIIKYTYDRETQLLLGKSDPRHTKSADPLHPESLQPTDLGYDPAHPDYQDHQRHRTGYEYGPRGELKQTIYPNRTRPSDATGIRILEQIRETLEYSSEAGKLRLRSRTDVNGTPWQYEYCPESDGPKAGFLCRELKPHVDWILNAGMLPILEINREGNWQVSEQAWRSSGVANESVRLKVEGVHIALYQSRQIQEQLSDHPGVEIWVDGQLAALAWNQSLQAEYTLAGLSRGTHEIEVRDTLGHPVSLGRIRSHVDVNYDIDDLGRILKITDACGHEISLTYDARGKKTQQVQWGAAFNLQTDYQYDSQGRLIQERREWRDEQGVLRPERAVVKEYQYDQAGHILLERMGAETGGTKRVKRHDYNCEDKIRQTKNPRGAVTYFDYDALGRSIRTSRAACSADRSITRTYYDRAGHVLFTRNPRGAFLYNGYWSGNELRPSIDALGRTLIQTDPAGHLLVSDYNLLNQVTITRRFQKRSDGCYEMLSRQEKAYDEHGKLNLQTENIFKTPILTASPTDLDHVDDDFVSAESQGHVQKAVIEYHLDANGNTIAQVNPDSGCRNWRYDGQNRVIEETDPMGNRSFRSYDACGNLTRIYVFEPVRNMATGVIERQEVFLQLFEYDEFHREIARIDAYGNRWEKQYDSLGNSVLNRDPLGNRICFEYNAFGEVKTRIQELTSTGVGNAPVVLTYRTEYEYDANGNLLTILDPAQQRTEYIYDALNREIESCYCVSPNEPKHLRRYDAAGNVVGTTDRNGLVKTMTYDALNRMVRMDIHDSQVLPENSISSLASRFTELSYDAAGQVIRHQNEYCAVDITRDSRGLAWHERTLIRNIPGAPSPQEIDRQFDLSGQRTQLAYSSGRKLDYGYDFLGRVTSIVHNQDNSLIAAYHYTGQRVQRIDYGNGLATILGYDGRGLDWEQSVVNANQEVIWRTQHLRDQASTVRLESSLIRSGSRTRKYYYDSIYRLAHYGDTPVQWLTDAQLLAPPATPVEPSATTGQALINNHIGSFDLPSANLVFDYDAMGNRNQIREPGLSPMVMTTNTLNQYAEVNGQAFTYDLNGNLKADDVRSFAFDANNTLSEIRAGSNPEPEVMYYRDGLGRVIAQQTADTVFRFYDGHTLLLETNGPNQREFTVANKPGVIVHVQSGNDHYWFTLDRLYSLRLLTNQAGTIVAQPSYRPFGESEDSELHQSPFCFGFAGMWYTYGVPGYQTLYRSYRPDLGRFLQRDPAGFVDGLNLYAYALNCPTKYLDPLGQSVFGDIQTGISEIAKGMDLAARRFGEGIGYAFKGIPLDIIEGLETMGQGATKMGYDDFWWGCGLIWLGVAKIFLQTPVDFMLTLGAYLISAIQTGAGIEKAGRRLTPEEQLIAREKMFGKSIDYSEVIVKEGYAGVLSANDRPFVLGNTIYMKDTLKDLAASPKGNWATTLVHELTHVWQFQTGGTDYMIEALFGQWFGEEYHWWAGSRETLKWSVLNPEQQAQLIEDIYCSSTYDPAKNVGVLMHDSEVYTALPKEAINRVRR